MRLFLSYGRRDARGLADRFRADLAATGHHVWRDVDHITAGTDFLHAIEDAIRQSDAVVALLSPHSVRRAADAGDQLDSVCLDELSYARFSRRVPIVPVLAVPCEPPFVVFRLDYVDLRDWQRSEADYQSGLARLRDALAAAGRGEARYRSAAGRQPPLEELFAAYLHERRQDFCGRQWLFDRIDAWRRQPRERALLIVGDPGVGKSALVGQLVHLNRGGQVLAYHCCRADTPDTLRPDLFVRNLAAMLALRLPAYAAHLDQPDVAAVLEEGACRADPASALERGVLAPLAACRCRPRVVVTCWWTRWTRRWR